MPDLCAPLGKCILALMCGRLHRMLLATAHARRTHCVPLALHTRAHTRRAGVVPSLEFILEHDTITLHNNEVGLGAMACAFGAACTHAALG